MIKKNIKTESENKGQSINDLIFGKRNYIIMGIGIFVIALGLLLMTGHDANTRPDGTFDHNYWNESIFDWRRIRLAPFLICLGFVIELYAILTNPNKKGWI